MYKILIIEDELDICEMLKAYLLKEGYKVEYAVDGEAGLRLFNRETPNLVILDIMMPKLDGIEVIKTIRTNSNIPVIFLSAKDSDVDKALGLGFGGDDYITKPFSVVELIARIKANIRRATIYSEEKKVNKKYIIGNLNIDIENYTITKAGEEVNLTMKEFEILRLFMENSKRVFTKAQLYRSIWNEEYYGDENVINVHIKRLRNKIEEDSKNPEIIKTIWGIGYRYDGN